MKKTCLDTVVPRSLHTPQVDANISFLIVIFLLFALSFLSLCFFIILLYPSNPFFIFFSTFDDFIQHLFQNVTKMRVISLHTVYAYQHVFQLILCCMTIYFDYIFQSVRVTLNQSLTVLRRDFNPFFLTDLVQLDQISWLPLSHPSFQFCP